MAQSKIGPEYSTNSRSMRWLERPALRRKHSFMNSSWSICIAPSATFFSELTVPTSPPMYMGKASWARASRTATLAPFIAAKRAHQVPAWPPPTMTMS